VSSDVDADALIAASRARGLSPAIGFVREVASTNSALHEAGLRGAAHGTALVAGRQTAGKGRLGRTWLAPEDHALALSVVLRPDLPVSRLPLVVLAAGVAVVRACGRTCRLKWPNDVLSVDGRKVAGILAEAELSKGRLDFVVVGVGINVGGAPDGPFAAASLAELLGEPPARAVLAAEIVAGMRDQVSRIARDPASILEAWRTWDGTVGRRVRVEGVEGVATGIGPDGALEIRDDAGKAHRILAGDVEMVRVG